MKARTTNLGHMLRVIVVVASLVGALAAVSPGTAMARSHDRDGDGLRNRWERLHSHTNPRVRDSNHNGIPDGREDPDHDGLKNKQEQRLHTDPLDADTDDDGARDGAEVNLGTDPLDPDDFPPPNVPGPGGVALGLLFASLAGVGRRALGAGAPTARARR